MIHCSVLQIIQALAGIPEGVLAYLMPVLLYILCGAIVLAFVLLKRKLRPEKIKSHSVRKKIEEGFG